MQLYVPRASPACRASHFRPPTRSPFPPIRILSKIILFSSTKPPSPPSQHRRRETSFGQSLSPEIQLPSSNPQIYSNGMDHNDDCSDDSSVKQLPSPDDALYAYGLYGEVGSRSRVGDEYQTTVPLLITETEYLDYTKNPVEEEHKTAVHRDFLIGLSIPIVWIHRESGNTKRVKREPSSDSNGFKEAGRIRPVPGCFVESWTKIERAGFLLGLYIFEKDFILLKRFIESKKMGDILAYYYGIFYRSDEYRRWSECRKSRGRRCILGQRIFSGLRQQELLCRLFSDVSHERQNSLLEVSRAFCDGKTSLEEYVFSLRRAVGLLGLVDAVAIGRGKQDLTGTAIEPTKQNQAIHVRPEIPTGKACSSLTSTEIVKFLTGDYRLSKARSNDLFWEAVWPRLLARGWHSEQPNGYNYVANLKHSLVFLTPAVKLFSRKLVKGEEYFDSVADVLNRVAADPQLLELDGDGDGNGETEAETKREEDVDDGGFLGKRKSHCYLQPRAPSRGAAVTKFTVVDTSIGGKIVAIRDLESLELGSRSRSDEVVSSDESDSANTSPPGPVKKRKTSDETKFQTAGSGPICLPGVTRKPARRENPGPGHHAKRRRRLSACSRAEIKSKGGDTDDLAENVGSSSQAHNKLSSNASFSSRASSIDTVEERQPPPGPMDFIDLNYPHVELGTETDDPGSQKTSVTVVGCDDGVSRRQSTRNRPPTARALEAIANGLLTVSTRKKAQNDTGSRSRNPRPSRAVDPPVTASECCSTGDASSTVKAADDENGQCSGGHGNGRVFPIQEQDQSEGS